MSGHIEAGDIDGTGEQHVEKHARGVLSNVDFNVRVRSVEAEIRGLRMMPPCAVSMPILM